MCTCNTYYLFLFKLVNFKVSKLVPNKPFYIYTKVEIWRICRYGDHKMIKTLLFDYKGNDTHNMCLCFSVNCFLEQIHYLAMPKQINHGHPNQTWIHYPEYQTEMLNWWSRLDLSLLCIIYVQMTMSKWTLGRHSDVIVCFS